MDEDTTATDIARLEEHIEALHESLARCRKIALAAKLLICAGAGILLFTLFGATPFFAAPVIAALAAVIGGIVLVGSNSSTRQQIAARLTASEAMRDEMIGRMDLQVVKERPAWH
jgi:hypothetical protein